MHRCIYVHADVCLCVHMCVHVLVHVDVFVVVCDIYLCMNVVAFLNTTSQRHLEGLHGHLSPNAQHIAQGFNPADTTNFDFVDFAADKPS